MGNLLSDETWWVKIISYDITEYVEQYSPIAQDPTDFIDVLCFYSQEANPEDQYNREVRSVHLEPFKDDNINYYQNASILPNNVFILTPETQLLQVFGIYAKPLCGNNTFLGFQGGNTLEEIFTNNTIGPEFYNNTIGSRFHSNTIGSYLKQIDFTEATHVYNSYNCFLFTRVDGSYRLKYCDNTDTEIIVAANA